MNEHKIVSNSNWFDKLIEFNLKGNLEGIQKHISVSEYYVNRAQYKIQMILLYIIRNV